MRTVKEMFAEMKQIADEEGYKFNPKKEELDDILQGLWDNEHRYGYPSCPCRMASGTIADDMDIICPCNYRDADVVEHGACYCALYVSEDWVRGRVPQRSIPERRPDKFVRDGYSASPPPATGAAVLGDVRLPYPVWRCQVCGYLAARDGPPEVCPVCKAKKERFERFL